MIVYRVFRKSNLTINWYFCHMYNFIPLIDQYKDDLMFEKIDVDFNSSEYIQAVFNSYKL